MKKAKTKKPPDAYHPRSPQEVDVFLKGKGSRMMANTRKEWLEPPVENYLNSKRVREASLKDTPMKDLPKKKRKK